MTIPIVDFSALNIQRESLDFSDPKAQFVISQLMDAMTTVGFVYLTNFGISSVIVEDIFQQSSTFFDLPLPEKQRLCRDESNSGYVGVEVEHLDELQPGDLKEAFNVSLTNMAAEKWPREMLPEFETRVLAFQKSCEKLALRILEAIGMGLGLADAAAFARDHSMSADTTLRLLHYPAIPAELQVKPGQIRCGEHSDYGTVTILFQDAIGGLEVRSASGEWIQATPIPDTVVINIGDLLQRWTNGRLKSTRHRVVLPVQEELRRVTRDSIAYFVHPQPHVVIQPLDNTESAPSITAHEYLLQRFAATY